MMINDHVSNHVGWLIQLIPMAGMFRIILVTHGFNTSYNLWKRLEFNHQVAQVANFGCCAALALQVPYFLFLGQHGLDEDVVTGAGTKHSL